MFLAKDLNDGWIILIVVLGFACIGGLSFLIYYLLKKRRPQEKKPDEKQAAEETLKMYLEDVEDPEIIKQYKENEEKQKDEEDSK